MNPGIPTSLTVHVLICLIGLASVAGAQLPSGNNMVELYGQGCAGNDGVVPLLYTNSNPVAGNPDFALVGDPLPAGTSAAYLLFASNPGFYTIAPGCDLWLDPSSLQVINMPISNGKAGLSIPLPPLSILAGIDVYMQMAVVAPSPSGLAMSPGVRVEFSEAQSEYGVVAALTGPPGNLTPSYHHRQGTHGEPGLPSSLSLQPIHLAGIDAERIHTRDARRRRIDVVDENPQAPAIQLQDLGRLYRFQDNQSGEMGFMVAHASAALMTPVLATSLGTGGSYSPVVGVEAGGDLVAAHIADPVGDTVILASLTGAPLVGSNLHANVSPPGPVTVDPTTMRFVGGALVAHGIDNNTGQHLLLAAPADGSQPLLPVTLPPLGNGTATPSLDPGMLQAGGRLALVARDGGYSDVYTYDAATGAVVNATQFSTPVVVDPLTGGGQPNRGALDGDGRIMFFTADAGNGRDGYVIRTDGASAGSVLGTELTDDARFQPGMTEIMWPSFGLNDVFVFVGTAPGQLDLFRFHMLGDDERSLVAPTNVTGTSGETSPPFLASGQIDVLTAFRNTSGTGLLFVHQDFTGLRDLVRVDLFGGPVTNVTGTGFGSSPMQSFLDIHTIELFATRDANGDVTERAVLVTGTGTSTEIGVWDAAQPAATPQVLGTGAWYDDVSFLGDGSRMLWVESGWGGSIIHEYRWDIGWTSPLTTVAGEIVNGTLSYIDDTGLTVVFGWGTNDPFWATDSVLESLGTRTGVREPITSVPSTVVVPTTTQQPYLDEGNPCKWTGDVDVTCFCIGKTSYMEVSINAENPSPMPITVTIEGNGPTFADGTKVKTVPCITGKTRFDIKANQTPGHFNVCLDTLVLPKRIRVIKAVHTFRNTGNFSADNKFPGLAAANDTGLGEGRDFYGARIPSIVNTMEIRFTLTPKDACGCTFDIKRTKDVKEYENGVLKRPRSGDDDSSNADEDLTPSPAGGNIYVMDAPGIHQPVGGANGDSREYHAHFTEWLEIRNKRRLERCSADILRESHLFVHRVAGTWVVNGAKSDISTEHDTNLNSQH